MKAHVPKNHIIVGVVFVISLLGFFIYINLGESYEQSVVSAEQNSLNIALLISKQAEDTIKTIDLIIQEIDRKIQLTEPSILGSRSKVSDLMRARLNDANYIRAFFVIGADGYIIHDTDHTTPHISLADRDYFLYHQTQSESKLYIGQPLISRSVGTWFVSLSRRVSSPDGTFRGVIIAALELKYIEKFYEELELGPNDIVSLHKDNGMLLVSWPEFTNDIGKITAEKEKILETTDLVPSTKNMISRLDQREKIGSVKNVKGYPLFVTVQIDSETIFILWLKKIQPSIVLIIVLFLTVIVFSRYILKYIQALKRYEENLELKNSQLKLSEFRYLQAQTVGQVGNWEYDLDSGVFWLSDEAKRLFGFDQNVDTYSLEDVEALAVDPDHVHQAFVDLVKNEKDYNIDYEILVNTGKDTTTIHAIAKLVRDEIGKPERVVAVIQDISQRKKSDEQLKLSSAREKELADIVRNAPIAIAYGYPDGRLEHCNAAFTKLTQYSIAELQQINWSDVLTPPKWRALEEKVLSRINPTNQIVQYEKEYIRKDGGIVPIQLTVTARFDSVGHVINYVGFIADITERKQAEAKIISSQKQLQVVTDHAPVMIANCDREQRYKFVNQQYAAMFGREPSDLVGLQTHEILGEDVYGDARPHILAALAGRSAEYELAMQNNESGQRTVHVSYAPEYDEAGEVIGFVAAIIDITASKKVEQQRLELEKQLRQKYKMEAVGVMAGGIAHNFNNNLAIILGNLEQAEFKLAANNEVSEFLGDAKTATLRSRDLVQQILSYSRQRSDANTPVALVPIFEETMKLLRVTIPSTVTLLSQVDAKSRLTLISADASKIQEILINLCNNAVQAMEEVGELKTLLEAVELQQQDIPANYDREPGHYVKLSVQDTGSGMSKETLEKIFDPFFTTKEVGLGTGMGLATVQGIVEQYGGIIKASSVLGQGSHFELYFPIIGDQKSETTPSTENEIPRGNEWILLVDDNEALAKLSDRMLSGLGYRVTTMTNSIEALEYFTDNPNDIDLIISDQTMPGLTGKELIRKLLKIRPSLPCVLCTGYSSKLSPDELSELNLKAFLMKPFEKAQLAQTIRKALDYA